MKTILFISGLILGFVLGYIVVKWQIDRMVSKAAPAACSELTWLVDSPQARCL